MPSLLVSHLVENGAGNTATVYRGWRYNVVLHVPTDIQESWGGERTPLVCQAIAASGFARTRTSIY
jgi:hypothetical protein